MKKLIIAALMIITLVMTLVMAFGAYASEITLQWDANDPTPDGYRLFQRKSGETFDYASPVWEGTETKTTLEIEDNVTYSWVVRAFAGDAESADSNELTYTNEPEPDPIIIPIRPKRLILEFLSTE